MISRWNLQEVKVAPTGNVMCPKSRRDGMVTCLWITGAIEEYGDVLFAAKDEPETLSRIPRGGMLP